MKFSINLASTGFVFCIASLFSCGPGNQSEKQNDTIATNSLPAPISSPAQSQVSESIENTVIDSTAIGNFIALFSTPDTEIPDSVAQSFFQTGEMTHYYTKELLENDSVYFLLYVQFVPAGPGLRELHAASYSKKGALIGDVLMGRSFPSSGPDGGGEEYDYSFDRDKRILSLTNTTIQWNEELQREVSKEVINFYQLDSDGNITNARQYPETSERLLTKGDLTGYSKDELVKMRNEIFAAHGYIFKTEPLKSYFNSKPWYNPRYDNVGDMLNDIEQTNIKLIKETENLKF